MRRGSGRQAAGALHRGAVVVGGLAIAVLIAGCQTGDPGSSTPVATAGPAPTATGGLSPAPAPPDPGPQGEVTLAFAGDLHFELHLAALLDHPRGALGPISQVLSRADLAMVNLETTLTTRGTPEPKQYRFRAGPGALDVLEKAGVDVVTMGNNHAVDYGAVGLEDTLDAIRRSDLPVVGIGRDADRAYAPYRVDVRGTDIAFFGVNARRERTSSAWRAGPETPGIAVSSGGVSPRMIKEVRRASERDDVVVVFLHWGVELETCPTPRQEQLAAALAAAGADVVVGSHTHVLQGSGWLGQTYVNYGLGNFVWYHDLHPTTGVLQLTIRDGEVVSDEWTPARIGTYGLPRQVRGAAARQATDDWRSLRDCTDLGDQRGT